MPASIATTMSQNNFQDYIDDFDRTASGAGSGKGTDRFSAQDIRNMFDERGELSKASGAQMVLDYADKAGDAGSRMGGGSERELDRLRGYLNDDSEEPTSTLDDQPIKFAHSPKVAHAKARLAQHQEDVWSGKTGTDLFGDTASTDPAQSFLERYKLKLGKQDDNGNYFEPEQVN